MTWPIKKGDLEPAYTSRLMAGDSPISLAGRTVKFLMRNVATGALKINAAATVVDEDDGRVEYAWAAGDTDTVGLYRAEWEITSAGKPRTVPSEGFLFIQIGEDLS